MTVAPSTHKEHYIMEHPRGQGPGYISANLASDAVNVRPATNPNHIGIQATLSQGVKPSLSIQYDSNFFQIIGNLEMIASELEKVSQQLCTKNCQITHPYPMKETEKQEIGLTDNISEFPLAIQAHIRIDRIRNQLAVLQQHLAITMTL